jgi:superfamily I DNA/RNA helicase
LLVDEYQDFNPGQIRLIDHFNKGWREALGGRRRRSIPLRVQSV